jgi:bacillithiol synthase
MQHSTLPFRDTHSFSDFFLDYIEQKDSLKPFYHLFPKKENFKQQIEEKKNTFPQSNRNTLVNTLTQQYSHLQISDKVKSNIESLSNPTTFTITTGHQLNIFTGPLYFIYKIVTVINACKKLKEQYPQYNFVPVYWMASEDHDYEEIKSFRLYGKKYTWTTEEKGAVGRFSTQGFEKLINELPGDINLFREAYLKNKTLANAVRSYVNALFENEGLVVVDADDRALKTQFIEVMQEDIFDNVPARKVNESSSQLESLGYHVQVHARDINFFYLDKQLRVRLEKKDEEFIGVDSPLRFSKDEFFQTIKNEPEKFSPNVILRPLYQEMILPNLAYIGGPAELVYWLQLKGVFDHYEIPFPMLMPRNFALVIDATVKRKLEKTGLEVKEYFESKNYLFNHWVTKNTHHNLTLGPEMEQAQKLFEVLKQRAVSIDKTLEQLVSAKAKRMFNSLEVIEKKFLKAEKRLHKDKLVQVEAVKDALFPNGSLQERTDNFLNFYQQDQQFIRKTINYFDPFDFRFNVISYE